MNITDELLAAYAEGNVNEQERDVVRRYLTDHPDELETVVTMMDGDYDLNLDDSPVSEDHPSSTIEDSFSNICYSAAAFVPHVMPAIGKVAKAIFGKKDSQDGSAFHQRLNDLLDEVES